MNSPAEPPRAALRAHLRACSMRDLRLGSLASLVAFSLFAVLDLIVVDESIQPVILAIRCVDVLAILFLFVTFHFAHEWLNRWIIPASFGVVLVSSLGIAAMTWFYQGCESPYYAGVNLVLLAAGFLFLWPPWLFLTLYVAVYLTFMAPLIIGTWSISDPSTVFITNQFFLLSTMGIAAIIQLERYRSEKHELSLHLQLNELATTDGLTGLFNRRYFFERGEEEITRSRRYHRELTAIMVDIDHFKSINDRYGHAVGDEMLKGVAQQLLRSLRSQDIVGRYGSEEFAILALETGLKAGTDTVGRRICESISEIPFLTSKGLLDVTVSVGVASLSEDIQDLSTLFRKADTALYEAKRTGRNRVVAAA